MIGEGQSEPLSGLKDEGIHHVCDIAVVSQQHPVLRLRQSQHLVLLVELQAQRLLVVPEVGAVASTAYLPAGRIAGERFLGIEGDVARLILVARSNVLAVGSSHVKGEHLILVLGLHQRFFLESQAVHLLHTEGYGNALTGVHVDGLGIFAEAHVL